MFPLEIAHRNREKYLFRDRPSQGYANQFASITSFGNNSDIYIMYNDVHSNFNKGISSPIDTVYSYDHANAVFYKLGKRREVIKHYLFGEPGEGKSVASMIESAAWDEAKGEYVTVVLKREGDKIKTHVAWCNLNNLP